MIGAGAFGTAMAVIAERCGNEVLLWAHDSRVAEAIAETGANPFYLPNVPLGPNIRATSSLGEAAAFSDTLFLVVPSHHYRDVLEQMRADVHRPVHIVSGTKGIENETLDRMSEVTTAVMGPSLAAMATLSGPTFAVEVARGDPTAAVVASLDVRFAQKIQTALSSPTFSVYHSTDVAGVEIAGALKNVIAIASGVLEGLGLGFNTTAALITRGLHEITRLGMALGGKAETFAGLAGIGDLVLTCTGSLSRNRSVGVALGHGKPLEAILRESRSVAEGVRTARAARDLAARHAIEMPITTAMFEVLYQNVSPRLAIQGLMTRSLKAEAAPPPPRS